jgi:hypothetical protein
MIKYLSIILLSNINSLPTIYCPPTVTLPVGSDCFINVPVIDNVLALDINNETLTYTQSPEAHKSLFTIGTYPITFTSSDGNTCETSVIMEDQTAPIYTMRIDPSYLTSEILEDIKVSLYFSVNENCCGYSCGVNSVEVITRPTPVDTCKSQGENCACRSNCGGTPCDASGGGGNLCENTHVCCCGDSCNADEEEEGVSDCDAYNDNELYTILNSRNVNFKSCPSVEYTLFGDCSDDYNNVETFEKDLTVYEEIPEESDPNCDNGISKGGVCCLSICGTCGGSGCSLRPGGAEGCCGGTIMSNNLTCLNNPAPCIL